MKTTSPHSMLYRLFKYCEDNDIGIHINYTDNVINLYTRKMLHGRYVFKIINHGRRGLDLEKSAEMIAKELEWKI